MTEGPMIEFSLIVALFIAVYVAAQMFGLATAISGIGLLLIIAVLGFVGWTLVTGRLPRGEGVDQ
jgi:hypothetical protein